MTYPKIVGASAFALALAVPVALSPMLASPAHAQFGFGRIVYDPSNYGVASEFGIYRTLTKRNFNKSK